MSLVLAHDLGNSRYSAIRLSGLAPVQPHRGRTVRCSGCWERAAGWGIYAYLDFDDRSLFDQAHEPTPAVTQASLSEEAFERAWAAGQALSMDAARDPGLAAATELLHAFAAQSANGDL